MIHTLEILKYYEEARDDSLESLAHLADAYIPKLLDEIDALYEEVFGLQMKLWKVEEVLRKVAG